MLSPVSAKIAVHVHATEEEDKVLHAVKRLLPDIDIKMTKEVFTGYFGNKIIRFEGVVNKPKITKMLFTNLFRKIKGIIYPGWIIERFDEKNKSLYIRIDKQAAYLGEIRLGWGDDIIHITFKFPGYLRIKGEDLEKEIEKLREQSE